MCLPGTDTVDQSQGQTGGKGALGLVQGQGHEIEQGQGQDIKQRNALGIEQSQALGKKQSRDQGIKQSQDQGIEQSQDLGIEQSQARGQVLPPEVRPLQRGQGRQAQRKHHQMKRKKILKVKFSNFERKRNR